MQTLALSVSTLSLGILLALGAVPAPDRSPPAQLDMTLATIHAATLSSARSATDTTDAPYLLVSIVGTGGRAESRALPAEGHWTMKLDEAKTGMPVVSLGLQPGDSVRVLLSLLEDRTALPEELRIATTTTEELVRQGSRLSLPTTDLVTTALAPLTSRGAHWLGSASLLLTNVGGTTYWTSMDCVASCALVRPPSDAATGALLTEGAPRPATGLVELTGASSVYHLQVALRRAP
jgi:hypothetical protein